MSSAQEVSFVYGKISLFTVDIAGLRQLPRVGEKIIIEGNRHSLAREYLVRDVIYTFEACGSEDSWSAQPKRVRVCLGISNPEV